MTLGDHMPLRKQKHWATTALGVLLMFGLDGCASYRAAPLPTGLATPLDSTRLAADAARLQHPRLRPLAVDLSRPLSPDQLAVIAVIANPELKAARAKADVAQAQAFQARLLPDPQVSIGFDKPLQSDATLVTALSGALSFDTSSLYRTPLAAAQGRSVVAQARLDLAWQEWQVAGQAKILAARILGLTEQATLTNGARQRAEVMLSTTLRATARGDLRGSDLESRRIAAADTAERARSAQRDLAAAKLDLNKLLGLPPGVQLQLASASRAAHSPLPTTQLVASALERRLDLLALRQGYEGQESAVQLAILDQYPRLGLTLTRARDTGGVQTFGPAVSFDLPLWNRNRGGIRVAAATRAQLRVEYTARLAATQSDIVALVSGQEIGLRQRAEIAAQVGPLQAYVAKVEAAARRGDLALSVADSSRQSLTDKEFALAVLDQALAEQRVALELAVGSLEETW